MRTPTPLGRLIDELLEQKKMTHIELARRMNRSQQSISQIKRSKRPHIRTIIRLAKALDVNEMVFFEALL